MFDRKCNPDKTNVFKYSQQSNNVGMSECPVCFWSISQRFYLSSQPGFISKGWPPSSFLVKYPHSSASKKSPSLESLVVKSPYFGAGNNLHCMENPWKSPSVGCFNPHFSPRLLCSGAGWSRSYGLQVRVAQQLKTPRCAQGVGDGRIPHSLGRALMSTPD